MTCTLRPWCAGVHLLHEASKGAASKWHLYIQQLPRRYNLLAVWTAAERAELQAPFAVAAAERCADEAGGLLRTST